MSAMVAMLRGVNVGGRGRMAMDDLRAVFTGLGLDDVRTYIQSGNVVFRGAANPTSTTPRIEKALGEAFGQGITVVLRTHAQLARILDRNPFAGADPARVHVTFLARSPERRRVGGLDAGAYLPDEFRVVGSEVYVSTPGGYGRSKITNTFFERALGVAATTRSMKTVAELARLSG